MWNGLKFNLALLSNSCLGNCANKVTEASLNQRTAFKSFGIFKTNFTDPKFIYSLFKYLLQHLLCVGHWSEILGCRK